MKRKWTPILFLDLDGTVRWGKKELGRFVNTPEDITIFENVVSLMQLYKSHGFRIVGVDNQGGVSTGFMTEQQLRANLARTDELCEGLFDLIEYSTIHPNAKDKRQRDGWDRKPQAGMLVRAVVKLQEEYPDERYAPYDCLLVGDRSEDRLCATLAKVAFTWAEAWRDVNAADLGTLDHNLASAAQQLELDNRA